MPRIDPNQLLKCLSSLLDTNGGIKNTDEVIRVTNLMKKFSKKLVSKCIYIQILKSTKCDLLEEFMDEGGWGLVFQWLDDAIVNNNYPVIREILELLLLCPISIDRLKENNSPKVIKGLSKGSEDEQVKLLAGILVEQWLKDIKSGTISDKAAKKKRETVEEVTPAPPPPPPKTVVIRPISSVQSPAQSVSGIKLAKSVKIIHENNKSSSDEEEVPPIGSLPLYKITVRDGKSVLAKVGTKTLSLPTKKVENESPNSVVLKSDAGSKKFRFVAKLFDKEKSDASEINSDDSSSRDKSEQTKTDGNKLITDKTESKSDETDSSEKSDSNKLKISSSKSKDVKSKDSHSKSSKSHSDRDKSDSRHKDKDRRESSSSKDDKKKSEHKNHKSDKDRDREKDRSKHKESSSKDKHHKSSSRDKDKEKDKKDSKPEKPLSAAEKAQIQADKDKDTLERLKTPAISLLGKIPKKSSSQISSSSPSSSKNSSNSSSANKVSDSPISDKSSDGKKSGDVKRTEIKGPKPKTVKTFNSKFRSTGLEEEIKPPPPRNSIKKKIEEKKPIVPKVESLKHSSTSPKDGSPPEKKSKIAEVIAEKKDKILDKPGGIKLIPPKPKPTLLESDMFSDALIASTKLEPRKRKRRTSSSKDGPDIKKEIKEEHNSESPKDVKPNLKFYRDTLEDDEEKNKENLTDVKSEIKTESDSDESKQTGSGDGEDSKPICKLYPNGVLVHKARRGPKKSVKWKEESELIDIKLFELDETERVNVTRNFVDMKLIERSHEREAFRMARKLATEDIMEEKIPWGPLYEVDIPPERRPAVEPGRSSEEKNVQYAREKTVLPAIYMYRSAIPDSPAEPDLESHPTTDPKIIPLEDITGNADSVSDFTNIPWPEPKPALIPSSPPPTQTIPPTAAATGAVGFPTGYSTVGNFAGFPQMGMPGVMPAGQGTWRTPDGKEMPMNMPFTPNGPICPPNMGAPPNMYPGGPEGYAMNGPQMPGFNPAFGTGFDPTAMYGPPPMAGMNPGGPPPNWNRGGWQGPPRGPCPPMNMPPKFPKGVCHQFAKFGSCSRGNNCRFLHPGVNCPPLT